MSQATRRGIITLAPLVPVLLLLATVGHQISWALAWDRFGISQRVVLLGALTMLASAWQRHGIARAATAMVGTVTLTWLIELIGVGTGWPFGRYAYSESVTYERCPSPELCSDLESVTHHIPALLGVPVIVPLAWFMMAYATNRLAWLISERRLVRWLWASASLCAWDLILDPQFLLDPQLRGHGWWVWFHPSPALPGIPSIPLSNYAGWLIAAAAVHAFLDFTLPGSMRRSTTAARTSRRWDVPTLFYVWTWFGGIFLGLRELQSPAVALWAGTTMAIPIVAAVRSARRAASQPVDPDPVTSRRRG